MKDRNQKSEDGGQTADQGPAPLTAEQCERINRLLDEFIDGALRLATSAHTLKKLNRRASRA